MLNSRKQSHKFILIILASLLSVFFTNCSQGGFEIDESLPFSSTDLSSISDVFGNDPLNKYSWHLENNGNRIFAAKANKAGMDLHLKTTLAAGYTGKNINVVISDDGVERNHEDLSKNIKTGYSYNFTSGTPDNMIEHAEPVNASDGHGTSVAGLIAAEANNGIGSRGIASDAKVISYNFLGGAANPSASSVLAQVSGGHDIYNMSWGSSQSSLMTPYSGWSNVLRQAVTQGRNGKGSILVKSAGNSFVTACNGSDGSLCVGSTAFDGDNSYPEIILVGALNGTGNVASYSSAGPNIWVSAFGGEYGDDYPAIMTLDRTGCSAGFSRYNVNSYPFEKGSVPDNVNCNYTSSFNGTSAAAPMVSGSVALLLEANPNLTWRDVKYILAKTARHIPFSPGVHPLNQSLPTGMVFDLGSKTNAAGFRYNNNVGFGAIDVDAAVTMARTNYVSLFQQALTSAELTNSVAVSIPDNSSTGATSTINFTNNFTIESVSIKLNINHARIGQLAVDLISPSNTVNRIIIPKNSLLAMQNFEGEIFLSNAFYMEPSQGTWKLVVYDAASGTTGSLTSWTLKVEGTPRN